jgi:hypothetical protein
VLYPADAAGNSVCVDANEEALGHDDHTLRPNLTLTDDAKKKGGSHRTSGFNDGDKKIAQANKMCRSAGIPLSANDSLIIFVTTGRRKRT